MAKEKATLELPEELILKRKKKNPFTFAGQNGSKVLVYPGVNRYTVKKDIEVILTHHAYPALIESGTHEEMAEIPKKPGNNTNVFTAMSAEKAINLVKETMSIAALEQMQSDEAAHKNRKTVIGVIEDQIKLLEDPSNSDLTDNE